MRRSLICSSSLCFACFARALASSRREAAAQGTPITNQTRQALNFYGGRSAFNTLSEMPRRSPIQPASAGQLQHNGKPFQGTRPWSDLSPYLNLFRDERGATDAVPSYYTFVRPQLEQQATYPAAAARNPAAPAASAGRSRPSVDDRPRRRHASPLHGHRPILRRLAALIGCASAHARRRRVGRVATRPTTPPREVPPCRAHSALLVCLRRVLPSRRTSLNRRPPHRPPKPSAKPPSPPCSAAPRSKAASPSPAATPTKLTNDKYTLGEVKKLDGNNWLFPTRIQYSDKDFTLPLTLPIEWAGDTPVVVVDNVGMPGLGTFSARVLFFNDHYAGYWQHGEVGGNLFGKIHRASE